jgi:transcriptional regulator with XRE-family HTH domain
MRDVAAPVADLKQRRLDVGMSQRQVSLRAGLAPSTVSEYESGKHEPTVTNLCAWAAVLDCDLSITPRPKGDDWTALWRRICQVATDQPGVQSDMEPERFARILNREKRPSSLDLAQIADAFGVTVAWLLTGSDHGMCEGTIAALQGELRLCTERIRALEADLPDLVSMCCHQAYPVTHTMACRNYAGPIDHWRVYSVPDIADLTVRGLAECTCGVRYPAAGVDCPNRAETWRGPEPKDGHA